VSEATVLIDRVEVKEGVSEKTGKPWKRLVVVDGNGNYYSSFEPGLFELARGLEKHRAVISFEQEGKFQNLTAIRPAEKPVEEKLGTGEYVKGQAAPSDARRILLCVAWERACELTAIEVRSNPSIQWTPALIHEAAEKHSNLIFASLLRKSGLMTDEDIPF
jgi:hypothetical protein